MSKPVAYRFKSPATEDWLLGLELPVGSRWEIEPLYNHPPRREWQGLTPDETMTLMNETYGNHYADEAHIQRFRKAVEAALRERNTEYTAPPQITHAENCWSWGPAHYECACAEIAKLRGWAK